MVSLEGWERRRTEKLGRWGEVHPTSWLLTWLSLRGKVHFSYPHAHPWSTGQIEISEIMVDEGVSLPTQQLWKNCWLFRRPIHTNGNVPLHWPTTAASCNCVSVPAGENCTAYSFSLFHRLKVKSKAKPSVFKLLVDKGSSSHQKSECHLEPC